MTLDEQISVLRSIIDAENYRPSDVREIIQTLMFLKRWEPEIRASLPTWKTARSDPATAEILKNFPDARITADE